MVFIFLDISRLIVIFEYVQFTVFDMGQQRAGETQFEQFPPQTGHEESMGDDQDSGCTGCGEAVTVDKFPGAVQALAPVLGLGAGFKQPLESGDHGPEEHRELDSGLEAGSERNFPEQIGFNTVIPIEKFGGFQGSLHGTGKTPVPLFEIMRGGNGDDIS
jgi:hypothetical protein